MSVPTAAVDYESTEEIERERFRRAVTEVVLFSLGLLAASAAIFAFVPDLGRAIQPTGPWMTVALVIMFGLAIVSAFHVEFNNEAFSFSLSEVPLALALVFVAPLPSAAARAVGCAVALAAMRKPPLYKLVFNISLFTFEVAIASLLVRLLVDIDEARTGVLVTSTMVAVLMAMLTGSIAISVTISRFEGDTVTRIIDELKSTWVLIVNAAVAGLLLGLALVSPVAACAAIVPVIAQWHLLRRHGEISQRLRDLDELHGFVGRIGTSLDLNEIGHNAVTETARLLRAGTTVLWLAGPAPAARSFRTGPIPAGTPDDDDVDGWMDLVTRSAESAATADDQIVTMVEDETGQIGVLLIDGPGGASHKFTSDDISHVRNLAEQLGTTLRKGMLHRQMQFEARHDGLTGLPNRVAFEEHVSEIIAAHGESGHLLMLDLDRFKEVNDTLGHHAGDELLIEFTRRVTTQLPPGSMFARLAGDEFAILTGTGDDESALELAAACVASASQPIVLDGLSVVVTASIGITKILAKDENAMGPMRRADIAMYNAKSHHIGIEMYRESLDRRTPARLSMLGDLRDAIENEMLGVEYQPKLDLASGSVTGAEALVRWTHAVRGVVPPADFVRVAEDTGLIKQLTDLMLSRGISTLRQFQDRGHHLGLSVNLSTNDLLDAKLAARVADHLGANDVDPGALTLEITESSLLIDGPRAQATINELNELGVRLSIDDFGTGYSSLSYLRQLPVSELKIDQSFVTNVLLDSQDEVIVKSTIDLGHNLGLEVVAEGVESEEVLDRLRRFGCDVAQGFCISRPLDAQRFLTWLGATEHPSRRADPMSPDSWKLSPDASPAKAPRSFRVDPVD